MEHTIAAISTAFGRGGIAVIRISGESAIEVGDRVFRASSGRTLAEVESNRTVRGEILRRGKTIDDGLATVFRAPRSYTGEDVVEISCHGGILLTERVLESLLESGAEPAQAGEFTRRAFVNGKLSLTEAEAVGLLIDAESDEQLAIASSQERGSLRRESDRLYEALKEIVTSVYAGVDFPDEDLSLLSEEEIIARLRAIERELSSLGDSYEGVRAITEGIPTAIVGMPNVGKSSLLNRLLGRERAIVTDIAGTTRDTLEESVKLGRVMLRLVDTAGIHVSDDAVERLGIERSLAAMRDARLILAVFDENEPDPELISQIEQCGGVKIAVMNKSDVSRPEPPHGFTHSVAISAKTGDGIAELTTMIESLFSLGDIDYSSRAVIMNARQNSAVTKSLSYLRSALSALECGLSPDTAGFDLESALSELSELDGRRVTEEIVDGIFHRFCVGK